MAEVSKKRSKVAEGEATSQNEKPLVEVQENVTIVLVQGFMAPWYSQYPIYRYLKWKGWKHVEIFKYDSVAETIEFHGAALADFVATLAEKQPGQVFYFYCTSMGNLVLRSALKRQNMPDSAQVGRHVAVGPPWRGTAWGRFVNNFSLARWISGNGCGKQLRTTALDGFDFMGHHPPTLRTLVIAGGSSFNLFIPRPNDGTILVEETLLRTPHHRLYLPWGIHTLFNLTPSIFWAAHQFFLGHSDGFEEHPGLDALDHKVESSPNASS